MMKTIEPVGKLAVPDAINSNITMAIVLSHLYVLVVLPLYLLPESAWWGLSIIPFFFMHSTQWGLIHEAIHKHLHSDKATNEYWGRVLSVLMGVSFQVLRFGHLMHHKLNREWQSELVEKRGFKGTMNYFYTLLGGLYVTEVLTGFIMALLPRKICMAYARRRELASSSGVDAAGERFFYAKGNIKLLRTDVLLVALIYANAFWLYSEHSLLLVAFLATRAVMVSFMDNIYHYGTEMDDAGKDLFAGPLAAKVLLNSNYHGTHHRNPQVSWMHLPQVHAMQKNIFDGTLFKDGMKQFLGPREKKA